MRRNNSVCLEKLSCTDCEVQPNTHIQSYANEDPDLGVKWFTSFCHVCHEQKGDPYGDKVAPKIKMKTKEDLVAETEVIRSCPIFAPIEPYRGIPPKFYRSWGCRLLYSEFDGKTPYAIGFPYSDTGKLVGWKARPFRLGRNGRKTMYAIGRTSNVDLWGLERALRIKSDTLWITEGEFDAIALDYCMTLAGDKDMYPVVSLTAGGGSLEKNFDYVESRVKRRYKHIVLVLDDDLVGWEAEEAAKELWGDIIKVVNKPRGSKDANEAVTAGNAMLMGKLALWKGERHEEREDNPKGATT